MGRWVAIFNVVVRGGLVEKVIFEQRLEMRNTHRGKVQSHS